MRFQLIPMLNPEYNRTLLRQHTKTFFLHPSTDDHMEVSPAVFWPDSDPLNILDATPSGEVIKGYCSKAKQMYPGSDDNTVGGVFSKRHCGVRITGLDHHTTDYQTYILRLLSLYSPSSIIVEGFSGPDRVVFRDIQVVIDATARAGHILRRIQGAPAPELHI